MPRPAKLVLRRHQNSDTGTQNRLGKRNRFWGKVYLARLRLCVWGFRELGPWRLSSTFLGALGECHLTPQSVFRIAAKSLQTAPFQVSAQFDTQNVLLRGVHVFDYGWESMCSEYKYHDYLHP